MSFKMGGSASKSSSTSNTTTNSTTTPIVPGWASDLTQTVAGQVGNLTHLDPHSLVAPAQPLHQQAASGATNLSGLPWNYDAAADVTRGVIQQGPATYAPASVRATSAAPASLLDNLSAYYVPYQSQITDPVLADLDQKAGQTRAQQMLDLAGSGAFGGSGAALTQSMTEGELARARASTLGGLLNNMFSTSTSLANSDAQRRQDASLANAAAANQAALANQSALNSAGQFNANAQETAAQRRLTGANDLVNLSAAYDANQRANIGTQTAVADDLRNIDQQQRQAPITTGQQIVAMLNGLPINLFTGSQTSGTQNTSQKGTNVGVYAEGSRSETR